MKRGLSGTPAPTTLDELKDRAAELRRSGAESRVGRRAFGVLLNMIDAPHEAAVQTVSELAAVNGVNASTLTRLVQRLGYKGFGALQAVFRSHISERRQYYSHQAELLMQSDDGGGGGARLMQRLVKEEIANVMTTVQELDEERLNGAAIALAKARNVGVLGLRGCFSVAHFLAYFLGLIRRNVSILGRAGHTVAEDLVHLEADDVLVAISYAPYTRQTVDICRFAREHGVRIIAITDSHSSPLAADATYAFSAARRGPYFFNATTSSLILVETLLALAAQELGSEAVAEPKRNAAIFDEPGLEVG